MKYSLTYIYSVLLSSLILINCAAAAPPPVLYDPLENSTLGTFNGGEYRTSGNNGFFDMGTGYLPTATTDEIVYDTSVLNPLAGTVEFWIKIEQLQTTWQPLFLFSIHHNWPDGGLIDMRIHGNRLYSGVGRNDVTNCYHSWQIGEYHHVAITYSASGGKIYTDGTLCGSHPYNAQLGIVSPYMYLGNTHNYSQNPAHNILDEFAIYGYEKTAEEILSDYQSPTSPHQTDRDGDGINDDVDNCPDTSNSNQTDTDEDGTGDACDTDDDNDGFPDTNDNCPLVFNPLQSDWDGDSAGDLCDTDADGDNVLDADDNCLQTYPGDTVNVGGCSIADLCPCTQPDGLDKWKNHGAYVSCIAHTAQDFLQQNLISEEAREETVYIAGESSCGKKQ